MKEIKQKPAGGKPKTADAARVPKAVVKAAWLQAREAARAGEKQVVGGKDGAYSGAADTGEKGADKLVSTGERVTELAYRGGRKLAERSAGQRRERAKAAQTGGEAAQRHGAGETIAHTSTIEASRPPQTREAGRVSDENRPAGARPQQRESRAVGRAKPIHDLVSRANQTIKSSIVSSLNLIIALYTPLATIVLQLASLVWVAWYVPILIAVFNVPYIFILVKSNHRRYELERKITKEKRVEKYFVELLSDRYAAKDIRTYDLVNFFFSKMIDVKEKITLEYKRLCQKNTFQRTIATVTQSMAMAMALLLTGYLVIKKKTPIGAFVLVYNTGRNLQSAVSSFVGTISTWDQFGINFADWNRLMNLEEEPEGDEDCIDKIHEIEMKNVEFRYPQRSESAVKNINLRILTGEKIAIVGENGSGKTTLLYLLLGIYRPISGEASVNGKTMELNLDNYRKKTACLIQNFVHFQMTLRENLAPNDFSELSEDPLIDFANNFPDRLNTFLGALDSNGVELSGGQWKRIALYRTLHKKDVDLIVLDEPTANLDPKISENIINRLLKPNYNKTVIVITHDFELAKKFDRIIGMKEGKIICDSPPQAFAWELFEKHNSDKRSLPQIG